MTPTVQVSWTGDMEVELKTIQEACQYLAKLHTSKYAGLVHVVPYIQILTATLTAISGFCTMSLTDFLNQRTVNIIVSVLCFWVSIVNGAVGTLGLSKKMEMEDKAARAYVDLAFDIRTMLGVEIIHRTPDGRLFLEEVRDRYKNLRMNNSLCTTKQLQKLEQPTAKPTADVELSVEETPDVCM